MDKTEFIQITEFEARENLDPDEIIAQAKAKQAELAKQKKPSSSSKEQDLLDELGI